MSGDFAVVIPTLNEAESIGAVVTELRQAGVGSVFVCDGGSRDATGDIARTAGATVIDAGKGYGRACLAGATAARAPIIVFMDGDGADDPAFLSTLVDPIRSGACDFAIGSRWRGRRAPASMSLHQIAAGLGIGLAIRLLYGVAYTDMCAFRVIRRDTLMALDMREMTYGWNLEMQLRVARSGLRVFEAPVDNRARIGGQSNVSGSLKGSIRAGRQILSTFYRVAGERRPKADPA
jgi:glycosyltransferase involved in cell wall biosynthesis